MNYTFDSLTDPCSLAAIKEMLDLSERSIDNLRAGDPQDPFAWVKGVHWFQPGERGRITYNKAMIKVWLVAKSQNDAEMHSQSIIQFQQSIPSSIKKIA